ncbi:MAG: class I SAM-dependent methyltransferase, partial [Rhodospirillaceae bacterium]|nr:class I SAM-dependent methyltransferase [Rhodospirillaceae bacterium]
MKAPDWNRTAEDYARHRAGFPDWFYGRLMKRGLFSAGTRILDLGTGTGHLARGFALRGATVTGLDLADGMMAAAMDLDAEAGTRIAYVTAPAEATGLPAQIFELVTAGTCWHWFDGARAAGEAARVLKPGGHLLIANLIWLSLSGNVVAATEDLIRAHNPAWNLGTRDWQGAPELATLAAAGYANRESFSVDFEIPYSPEAWRGRIRASAGIAASLGA